MDAHETLAAEVDYWGDGIGCFDPERVLGSLRRAFPEAVIDLTDLQDVRLQRELGHWAQVEDTARRETLVRQSRGMARRNGPMYRFEIPTAGGRVTGHARRYSVSFALPRDTDPELRARVVAFLRSLRLGAPEVKTDDDSSAL
jgi:hypothetical protein